MINQNNANQIKSKDVVWLKLHGIMGAAAFIVKQTLFDCWWKL